MRRLAALALIACGAACSSELDIDTAERPLIGGTPTSGDEAVVALATASNFTFCTGTLVSPSVIVTAAHCIDDAGANPQLTAFFGADTTGDGRRVSVDLAHVHPEWNGSISGGRDLGLLRLAFPQDPLLPIPLNTSPVSEHIGEPLRRVGFGIHDRDSDEIDGKKREGNTVITAVLEGTDYFLAGDEELATCNGDSGGPGLLTLDGDEYLAGVHSFGFSSGEEKCVPPNDGDVRVDMHVELIRGWIQANDPACAADGLCAPIGCTDDPDCEPCGPDGVCTQDCPLPDWDCTTQELGEICQADTQCHSGLCVFWEPEPTSRFCSQPCAADDDCPGDMSCRPVMPFGDICYYDEAPPGVAGSACATATDCGSYLCAEGVCVIPCDVGAGKLCPAGFECAAAGGSEYFCRAEARGGCAAGGPGSPWLILLLLAGRRGLRRRA